jgi:hypothetical protein
MKANLSSLEVFLMTTIMSYLNTFCPVISIATPIEGGSDLRDWETTKACNRIRQHYTARGKDYQYTLATAYPPIKLNRESLVAEFLQPRLSGS